MLLLPAALLLLLLLAIANAWRVRGEYTGENGQTS